MNLKLKTLLNQSRHIFRKKKFNFFPQQLIVCLEHTGIYTYPVLDYLTKKGIKVCLEPALQIKQSQGMKRGKSDKVDARRIAQYAYKNRHELKFWRPQRDIVQKIKALLVARDRLVKVRVQLATPIEECQDYIEQSIRKRIIRNCQDTLKALAKDIAKVEQEVDLLIKEDTRLQQQVQYATSFPGIGKITALNVIVATNEFEKDIRG